MCIVEARKNSDGHRYTLSVVQLLSSYLCGPRMLLLDTSKTHSFLCNALLVISEQGNDTLDLFELFRCTLEA